MRSSYFFSFVAVWFQLFNACALLEERSQSGGETPRFPIIGLFPPIEHVPGGRPVELKEFPYLVLLEFKENGKPITEPGTNIRMTLSGSIPSRTTVLTIYCLRENTDIIAYAGLVSSGELEKRNDRVQMRQVTAMESPSDKIREIAIGYVNNSWEWTDFVRPITLHLGESSLKSSVMSCQAMGFWLGLLGSGTAVAHVMDVKIGSGSQCGLENEPGRLYSKDDEKKMIMFYMGGPAVCNSQQRGINFLTDPLPRNVRSSETQQEDKICNIYTDIAYYRDWIRANIKDLPSSADGIHHYSEKISEVLLGPLLSPLLLKTVELLHRH